MGNSTNQLIGVDVGGTNTDAVRLCSGRLVARAKVATTPDIQTGIVAAVEAVRGDVTIDRVHIGTTAFTNSLIERRDLAPVAAIRVGAPVSESLPPMIDWPEDLRAAVRNAVFFVRGGREYNGRSIGPLDRVEIRTAAAELTEKKICQVAVTAVFGTSYPEDELRVQKWLREANPALGVTLSHRIGHFGILERENATMLNAMLRPLAMRTLAAYRSAVSRALYISQNDGTVMRAENAAELPVFTVASGPTNSLRGAAMLSGVQEAIVLDVGGTTTDAGLLQGGYPQAAGLALEVAGVRTNFRMPDISSIGVGGGSLVDRVSGSVGPESVGFRLTEDAVVFGGSSLTLTDIAVAAGRLRIGDVERVRDISKELIASVDARLRERFTRLLEKYDRLGRLLPVVVVGGGAVLVAHIVSELGRRVICPVDSGVANAYGAALAQVGGEADLTFSLKSVSRSEALARAEREAHRRAEEAGARPGSIETIELEDAALNYLASDAFRVRAKAVGDVAETRV